MESNFIIKLSDNIISPLGLTSEENFQAILDGRSELMLHDKKLDCHEKFCGSLFDRENLLSIIDKEITSSSEYTFFEKLCIYSVIKAIKGSNICPEDSDVVFILSTTKGNVELLSENAFDERCYLSESAFKINSYFRNKNQALVVSNACISGVSAQITAVRLLLAKKYRTAIVIGCDILSNFIISGFQSFKALSDTPCKPFDKERTGLNLGEAVGTLILQRKQEIKPGEWYYIASSNHNDANHISGPSRTGEGSFRVLKDIGGSVKTEEIAFINIHGTATPYNDEMESIALERAGLNHIPINGLKGYYGHTLGAAGVIETIISMHAIDHNIVLGTKGYSKPGTSRSVNISPESRVTDKKAFIKLLSGFGGCNAGICYGKGGEL